MDEGSTSAIAAAERHIIERPRLTKILDESNARLILLVAPAGYGKTTLARQWLRDKPHVWYQATSASADPVAIARSIERLLDSTDPCGLSLADVLASNPSLAEDPSELATALLERALPRAGLTFVVDDYHLIECSPPGRDFLRACVAGFDARCLLISRLRPNWITVRMRAYGDVT